MTESAGIQGKRHRVQVMSQPQLDRLHEMLRMARRAHVEGPLLAVHRAKQRDQVLADLREALEKVPMLVLAGRL